MNLSQVISVSVISGIFFFSPVLMAAPLKITSSLPLSGNDLIAMKSLLKSETSVRDLALFIKELDVFPDHKNVKTIDKIENKTIEKIYYMAPFFQASEERSVVGSQEMAEKAITIINELYDLLGAFDFELLRFNQIVEERKKKETAFDKLRKNLESATDELTVSVTTELLKDLGDEIAKLKAEEGKLQEKAETGLNETSSLLKRQVISQIQLKLSFLGITATRQESILLKGASASGLREGIASMIARGVNLGQFGYRTATFESGFSEEQRKWISVYRRVRPDVHVVSLPAKAVFARSIALTSKDNKTGDPDYFLGESQIVSAARLFLSVNGGSNGACGNTRACNVIIEYTWLGANMAQTSRSGAITMPIYFEGDVMFAQPDFDGSVSCDFSNGFMSSGRSDVVDGAVIYDGDVYNEMNHEAIEDGSCNYEINKGDADSAAYHTIKHIYDNYIKLKMQRAAKSRAEKDQYKDHLDRELNYHANNSKNSSYDSWSITTWTTSLGEPWGIVTNFIIDEARDFYWHTRIEDSSVMENVKFTTHISESNIQKMERVAFDGFLTLCWKKDGVDLILTACPANNMSKYQKNADTDLGKNRSLCGDDGLSADCQSNVKNDLGTDENGVTQDPWA